MKISRHIEKLLEEVNYFVLLLIGIFLIFIGAFIPNTYQTISIIFTGVGSSITASALILVLSSKFNLQNKEIMELYNFWGLNNVFETRSQMNTYSNIHIDENKNEMDVISLGLKGLKDVKGDIIKQKVAKGMKIRIITMNPESQYLLQREIDEKAIKGELRNAIIRLEEWVEELVQVAVKQNQIELRYYDSLLQDFYFRLDNALYIGPYFYGKDSQETISYEFRKNYSGYNYYKEYFEKLWNNSKFCKSYHSFKPNYFNGRFFLSPILGCKSNCKYCYIKSYGFDSFVLNSYSVERTINYIKNHNSYIKGKFGSIISIGAWGDVFSTPEAINHTKKYLKEILKTGNPVQIMSKSLINEKDVVEISGYIQYENQMLFSTTITTFSSDWQLFEKGCCSPLERLSLLELFKKNGIPVNVMIKPFLYGITDKNIEMIKKNFKNAGIKYCVVGDLFWDDYIQKSLASIKVISTSFKNRKTKKDIIMACSNHKMKTFKDDIVSGFIKKLRDPKFENYSINAFKKSSCVNSKILNVKNPSKLYLEDNSDCLKDDCKNCISSKTDLS